MTGDFALGGLVGFAIACVIVFVGGWLSQEIEARRREWLAAETDPYDDGSR